MTFCGPPHLPDHFCEGRVLVTIYLGSDTGKPLYQYHANEDGGYCYECQWPRLPMPLNAATDFALTISRHRINDPVTYSSRDDRRGICAGITPYLFEIVVLLSDFLRTPAPISTAERTILYQYAILCQMM